MPNKSFFLVYTDTRQFLPAYVATASAKRKQKCTLISDLAMYRDNWHYL